MQPTLCISIHVLPRSVFQEEGKHLKKTILKVLLVSDWLILTSQAPLHNLLENYYLLLLHFLSAELFSIITRGWPHLFPYFNWIQLCSHFSQVCSSDSIYTGSLSMRLSPNSYSANSHSHCTGSIFVFPPRKHNIFALLRFSPLIAIFTSQLTGEWCQKWKCSMWAASTYRSDSERTDILYNRHYPLPWFY